MAAPALTCQACHLLFASADEHRVHYRSDLHRLNAKRRAAGLVPISAEEFNERVREHAAATAQEPAPVEYRCNACERVYHSAESLEQHLNTKKHKEAAQQASATGSAAPVTSTSLSASQGDAGGEPATPVTAADEERMLQERLATAKRIPANECIFCPHTVSVTEGVAGAVAAHMASAHGFFLPDVEYLADLPGLLAYLADKAAVGYACLYCPRSFYSLEAVRGHMRDVSHCKLKYDTEEDEDEYADFYDFSLSYAAPGLPDALAPAADPAADPREGARHAAAERLTLSEDGFSMQVNGKSVGHRALRIYYRQAAPRARPSASESARAITHVVGEYRLLGWRGTDKAVAHTQARADRRAQQKAASLALAVGVRQNRIQKNHPRDQTTLF